jgi:hypothetical protein
MGEPPNFRLHYRYFFQSLPMLAYGGTGEGNIMRVEIFDFPALDAAHAERIAEKYIKRHKYVRLSLEPIKSFTLKEDQSVG